VNSNARIITCSDNKYISNQKQISYTYQNLTVALIREWKI
jgi:hypothetical protein